MASSFSASICFSYSAHSRRMSSSLSSLLRGRGGGEADLVCLGGRGGGSLVTGARSLREAGARVLVGTTGAGLRVSDTGADIWRLEADSEVRERLIILSASRHGPGITEVTGAMSSAPEDSREVGLGVVGVLRPSR